MIIYLVANFSIKSRWDGEQRLSTQRYLSTEYSWKCRRRKRCWTN